MLYFANGDITARLRAITHACVLYLAQRATSLFVAILIIYPYQTPTEGQYLAKGDEYAVVNLAQWWANEAREEQYASKDTQTYR